VLSSYEADSGKEQGDHLSVLRQERSGRPIKRGRLPRRCSMCRNVVTATGVLTALPARQRLCLYGSS